MTTERESSVAHRTKAQPVAPAAVPDPDEVEAALGEREFKEQFGEDLARIIDVDTWKTGVDWEAAVDRFRGEIRTALAQEERLRATIRDQVLPLIGTKPDAPKEAGIYRATLEELVAVHEGLLFPGRVEAVDGTSASYDSLPIGITQIGIAVVSYGGTAATFAQRIFRKEIAAKSGDAFREALDLIEKRDKRSGVDQPDSLSDLARRGIMTYAERRILVDKASAEWRIGHGSPCPYELLTGSGHMGLLHASLDVLERMIMGDCKFVFVPSAPGERGLLTIGNALGPGEYLVVDTIQSRIAAIVENGHYGADHKRAAEEFVRRCGSEVLYGIFRASEHAPAYLFYAPRKHIHVAARLVMADSLIRPERGFPLLIDVADVTCRSAFGADGFMGLIHEAYARAGGTLRYFSERDTRR